MDLTKQLNEQEVAAEVEKLAEGNMTLRKAQKIAWLIYRDGLLTGQAIQIEKDKETFLNSLKQTKMDLTETPEKQ